MRPAIQSATMTSDGVTVRLNNNVTVEVIPQEKGFLFHFSGVSEVTPEKCAANEAKVTYKTWSET